MKKVLIGLLLAAASFTTMAQPGSSCATPFALYPGLGCTNTGADQSALNCPVLGCTAGVTMSGTSNMDAPCTPDNETTQAVYWLRITATGGTLTLNNLPAYSGAGITGTSPENVKDYAVYSGSCGSLSLVSCATLDADGGPTSQLTLTGAAAGQVFMVMVSPSAGAPSATLFRPCLTSDIPFTPTNSSCNNPAPIFYQIPINVTTAGAGPAGPICWSMAMENTIWFK